MNLHRRRHRITHRQPTNHWQADGYSATSTTISGSLSLSSSTLDSSSSLSLSNTGSRLATGMMQPSGPTDLDIPTVGSSMSPDASSDDSFGDSIQGSSSARHWWGPRGLAYHICQGNLDRKFGHRRPPANVGCQNVELSPDLGRIIKEPIRSYSIYWEGQ